MYINVQLFKILSLAYNVLKLLLCKHKYFLAANYSNELSQQGAY